jgi:hypothetical protein
LPLDQRESAQKVHFRNCGNVQIMELDWNVQIFRENWLQPPAKQSIRTSFGEGGKRSGGGLKTYGQITQNTRGLLWIKIAIFCLLRNRLPVQCVQ